MRLHESLVESLRNLGNHVAVKHPPPQIGERAANVHALLVVPVGQEEVRLVVRNWLATARRAVEGGHVDRVQLLLPLPVDNRVALVVSVEGVSRVSHAQLKVDLPVLQLSVQHRGLEDGREEEELLVLAVRPLGDGKRLLQFH